MFGRFVTSLLTLLLFTHISSDEAIAQWEVQESGVTVTLRDICFIDNQFGWAVGDSSTIIATRDGGKTWRRQYSALDTIILEEVNFVNQDIGYIVGTYGTILSTKDGGTNWVQNESGVDYSLFDLSFVNADTGWVVGGDFSQARRNGVILYTENGGQTWGKQLETHSINIFSSKLFRAVSFIDKENGWAFASDYVDNFSLTYVYRTTSGGKEWNIIGTASAPLREISIASGDTVWAGGIVFAKSNDGGLNWQYTGGNVAFGTVWDVQAIDGERGWVGVRSLLFTEDGLQTSTDISPEQEFQFRAMTNVGEHNLWTVGVSGIVLKYTSMSTEVVDDKIHHQPPQKFILNQNFPNPFNAGTVITFQVPIASLVTVKVYDILSNEVRALLNETPYGQEEFKVFWNGQNKLREDVSSGLYLYQLFAGGRYYTKKMLLIR